MLHFNNFIGDHHALNDQLDDAAPVFKGGFSLMLLRIQNLPVSA